MNRKKVILDTDMFNEIDDGFQQRLLLEIDCAKYLISVKDKYKIPDAENEVTMNNLKDYLETYKKQYGDDFDENDNYKPNKS